MVNFEEIEEIIDSVEKNFNMFKNFDTKLYPPVDHHFIDYRTKPIDPQSTLARKIRKEWKVLETSLPSSIFVRAYEERINLMRAAIAGLEGTPYCHGLFFFDILIPSTYPAQPPEIFFYSYNFDFNPHLNSSGKRLSLDLLWNSRKEQICDPKEPDILQVLVTIQQEVLNGKPYSDESKSNMQGKSDKSNKEVFMLNCEAMLHTLQIPPRHFEDLVHGHFRKRAHPILLICKKQINDSNDKIMNQLFLRLLEAFERNGTYCRHHYNTAIKEEERSGPSEEKVKNTSFINNLKKFLKLG